jgi:hypothetical protein
MRSRVSGLTIGSLARIEPMPSAVPRMVIMR